MEISIHSQFFQSFPMMYEYPNQIFLSSKNDKDFALILLCLLLLRQVKNLRTFRKYKTNCSMRIFSNSTSGDNYSLSM